MDLESRQDDKIKARNKNRRHMIYLAVAYAANTGNKPKSEKSFNFLMTCFVSLSRWNRHSYRHRIELGAKRKPGRVE